MTSSEKLSDHPDQRSVRERINKVIKSDAPIIERDAQTKPVIKHLKRAMDKGRMERHAPFIRTLGSVIDSLVWEYGYEKVPRGLEKKYAYAELVGPTGPVIAPTPPMPTMASQKATSVCLVQSQKTTKASTPLAP